MAGFTELQCLYFLRFAVNFCLNKFSGLLWQGLFLAKSDETLFEMFFKLDKNTTMKNNFFGGRLEPQNVIIHTALMRTLQLKIQRIYFCYPFWHNACTTVVKTLIFEGCCLVIMN